MAPESVDVKIWPGNVAATSFVPSEDEATEVHNLFASVARGVQVAPESGEV